MNKTVQVRVNIYLDDPGLRTEIKVAAANQGVSLSAYCVDAIRERLSRARSSVTAQSKLKRRETAAALDRLRSEIGPIGISVRELIDEGRRM
jgi:hypothetical protein